MTAVLGGVCLEDSSPAQGTRDIGAPAAQVSGEFDPVDVSAVAVEVVLARETGLEVDHPTFVVPAP